MNDETRDDCLQELERINMEIETVRHEVEQEQRRLSHYQAVQTDSKNTAQNVSISKTEAVGKNIDRGSCLLSSCTDFTKSYSRARKYVVDNSKPRTDLEYDPLSNFSADLRSYSSSGKEQKHIKKGQGLKRARNPLPCDQKKPLAHPTQLSISPYSEPLDDSNEDDVLIIDIPPSPEKKRSRAQKLADCVAGKSQNNEELEVKREPILFDSPLLCTSNTEMFKVGSASRIEGNQNLTDLYENKETENISGFGSVTKYLGDQGAVHHKTNCFQLGTTEIENSPEPASLSATADHHSWNTFVVKEEEDMFQAESSQCELPPSVVKMNPLLPCDFPQTNSLFYKPPVANSHSLSRQHTKQAQTEEQVRNKVRNHSSPKKIMPLLEPDSQKMLSKMPGHMQDKSVINHTSCVRYQEQAEQSVSSHLTNITESEPSQQLLVKADDKEVIIIESSCDEEDLNCSEVELSDSDPMEECYRIFMEANNENKGNEEQSGISVSVFSTLETLM